MSEMKQLLAYLDKVVGSPQLAYLIALVIWGGVVWAAVERYGYWMGAFWVAIGIFIAAPLVGESRRKAKIRKAINEWRRKKAREDAMREGIVEHRLGVDDFEDAKAALAEGKFVFFDTEGIEDGEDVRLHRPGDQGHGHGSGD
jgi:hypothetical protein